MKALKIWGWVLLASSIILYSMGLFSGEFNKGFGLIYYGTSAEAMLLSIFSAICLLLAITVMFVIFALTANKAKE